MSYSYEHAIATTNPKVINLVKQAEQRFEQHRVEFYESNGMTDAIEYIKSGKDAYGKFKMEQTTDGVWLFTTETNKMPDAFNELYDGLGEILYEDETDTTEYCVVGEEGETTCYGGMGNWIRSPRSSPVILLEVA